MNKEQEVLTALGIHDWVDITSVRYPKYRFCLLCHSIEFHSDNHGWLSSSYNKVNCKTDYAWPKIQKEILEKWKIGL